jgi:hypothetical protein
MDGDRVTVDLTDMSITMNGAPRSHPPKMLHDCEPMKSEYGSGKITITTKSGTVTFDSASFRPEPVDLPKLPEGMTRWGNPHSEGSTTKVDHARTLGGTSPDHDTLLKSVSILIPHNKGGSVRLAVYAGGQLAGGPQAGSPAKLLFDFGQTPKGQTGWNTLEHPNGIPIPANTPIWLAWKGSGARAEVVFSEERSGPNDFQPDRGRWESKVISRDPAESWPMAWPKNDGGGFDAFEYSCFLTLEPLK